MSTGINTNVHHTTIQAPQVESTRVSKPISTTDSKSSSAASSVFQKHNDQRVADTVSSKEFETLKAKFTKIAEKEFDKKIYSSTFESKHDAVKEAFLQLKTKASSAQASRLKTKALPMQPKPQ